MTVSNVSKCPKCGNSLKYYDQVKRLVRTKGGIKKWIKVKRFRCINCNGLHRHLPEFIFPYKHYATEIIAGVIDGYITSDTLGFEDFPCEKTMLRWREKNNLLYEQLKFKEV